ncbi:hypothetical protein SBI67_17860 [Mycolicibacterium sp. 120266]|uniref:hypothetical protein n=1 Tax=Mycolicibacterium sp. 120266 TaxID=3090601 RepID=UPI00299F28E9|nr:hypothetical protein [Mycolicibacterium sp. 120266]MDX1873991.1 hypothetical protein [Mycolicibacterium sp. 120266]
MDDTEVTLLRPFPTSIGVQVHPHVDGDVVSVVMLDAATTARYIIAMDPDTAHQLSRDLHEATTSPAVAAQANAIRGSTGHTDGNTGLT